MQRPSTAGIELVGEGLETASTNAEPREQRQVEFHE